MGWGAGNIGGGGTSLNFKVVGNPQPESPKENTIWVNTDVPIGAWYFAAPQPENMAEGDVWFQVGVSSSVEFDALKKNGIQVYPISAQQYVGGTLVGKTAQTYQGGKWVDWILNIFENGVSAFSPKASTNMADFNTPSGGSYASGTAKIEGGKLVFGDNSSSEFQVGGYIFTGMNLAGKKTLHLTRSKSTGVGPSNGVANGDINRFTVQIGNNIVFTQHNVVTEYSETYNIDISNYGVDNATVKVCIISGGDRSYKLLYYVPRIWAD